MARSGKSDMAITQTMKFRLALLSSFFVFVAPAMAQDGELLEYQQATGRK